MRPETHAEVDRDSLFRANLDWADRIAENVHRKIPPSFDLQDLQQECRLEMWKQTGRYDPERNDNFQGFAYLAVRGAALMAVRRRHWAFATHKELPTQAVDPELGPAELARTRGEIRGGQWARVHRRVRLRAEMHRCLSDGERALIEAHLDGIPQHQVAASHGLSVLEAGRGLARAVRRLQSARRRAASGQPITSPRAAAKA